MHTGEAATISDIVVTVSGTQVFASDSSTALSLWKTATLTIDSTAQTISTGSTASVIVTATKAGADAEAADFTAVSSDTSVATVSPASGSSGSAVTITGVSAGEATITFTNDSDSDRTAVFTITVADYPASNGAYSLSEKAYPASGASAAYYDGEISLTFDDEPSVSTGGYVCIYDSDGNVVDTIKFDNETNTIWDSITRNVGNQMVRIEDKTVYIQLHANKLQAETAYYVAIPDGAITGTLNGIAFGGLSNVKDDTKGWNFTTKAAPDVSDGTVTVSKSDESADFRSVQAALYALKSYSGDAVVTIEPGTYYELLYYKGSASSLKLVGKGTSGNYGTDTVIAYANTNDMMNDYGTGSGQHMSYRSVADFESVNVVLEHLTINNTARTGDVLNSNPEYTMTTGQAEALFFNGSGKTLAVWDCSLISCQDTIYTSGKNWFYKCYIEGDVDYIWGSPTASLFEDCVLNCHYNSSAANAYVTQGRINAGTAE